MLEFESIHKWKTAVLYPRNCLVKFCRINDENLDFIGVFLGYIFFVASWWQRYKDSNLKWRSQRLAIFFQNRLFKPFFRLCVSQKSLRILFLLSTANSYEELRTLHRGVEKTLNPHYHLQQGTAPFDDKEYKRSLFDRI